MKKNYKKLTIVLAITIVFNLLSVVPSYAWSDRNEIFEKVAAMEAKGLYVVVETYRNIVNNNIHYYAKGVTAANFNQWHLEMFSANKFLVAKIGSRVINEMWSTYQTDTGEWAYATNNGSYSASGYSINSVDWLSSNITDVRVIYASAPAGGNQTIVDVGGTPIGTANGQLHYKQVSITPSQKIVFNYESKYRNVFLMGISATPNKSIILTQGYDLNGVTSDMTIKRDTTGETLNHALTLSDFPSPRTLASGEYLYYTQANGGNVPVFGKVLGTDTSAKVTFSFDPMLTSYKVLSANTGIIVDEGTTSGGIIDSGNIYNNNDGGGLGADLNDDFLLDRNDYADGILGSVEYGFDTLFNLLKIPFNILLSFFERVGEIVTYAVASIGGFVSSLQSLYGVLPTNIAFLMTTAIMVTMLKMLFGR